MLKKKAVCSIIVIVGAGLFGGTLLLDFLGAISKLGAGAGIGVGTALLGIGLPKLIMEYCEISQPEMMRLNRLEFNDERNTLIRDRAKAKSADIIQWVVMGVGYIALVVEAQRWVIFAAAGVFVLKNIIELFFNIKYQREL